MSRRVWSRRLTAKCRVQTSGECLESHQSCGGANLQPSVGGAWWCPASSKAAILCTWLVPDKHLAPFLAFTGTDAQRSRWLQVRKVNEGFSSSHDLSSLLTELFNSYFIHCLGTASGAEGYSRKGRWRRE